MSTNGISQEQRPAFWLAFNAALKVEMRKVGAYKPESMGADKADAMIVSIRDEWMDQLEEQDSGLYNYSTATLAAKDCTAWHVNTRLAQAQEHTTDNDRQDFGTFPFGVALRYSGGGYDIPADVVIQCTPAEFPYLSLKLIRELDAEFKKFNMARAKPEKSMALNEKPQEPKVGEPDIKRYKVTEIQRNVNAGKTQWRALTALFSPYGVPVYEEALPPEWEKYVKPGEPMKTDKWEIDVLMVWDEQKSQYKPKKVVAAYLVTPTGV